jgi:hypothetical protein
MYHFISIKKKILKKKRGRVRGENELHMKKVD